MTRLSLTERLVGASAPLLVASGPLVLLIVLGLGAAPSLIVQSALTSLFVGVMALWAMRRAASPRPAPLGGAWVALGPALMALVGLASLLPWPVEEAAPPFLRVLLPAEALSPAPGATPLRQSLDPPATLSWATALLMAVGAGLLCRDRLRALPRRQQHWQWALAVAVVLGVLPGGGGPLLLPAAAVGAAGLVAEGALRRPGRQPLSRSPGPGLWPAGLWVGVAVLSAVGALARYGAGAAPPLLAGALGLTGLLLLNDRPRAAVGCLAGAAGVTALVGLGPGSELLISWRWAPGLTEGAAWLQDHGDGAPPVGGLRPALLAGLVLLTLLALIATLRSSSAVRAAPRWGTPSMGGALIGALAGAAHGLASPVAALVWVGGAVGCLLAAWEEEGEAEFDPALVWGRLSGGFSLWLLPVLAGPLLCLGPVLSQVTTLLALTRPPSESSFWWGRSSLLWPWGDTALLRARWVSEQEPLAVNWLEDLTLLARLRPLDPRPRQVLANQARLQGNYPTCLAWTRAGLALEPTHRALWDLHLRALAITSPHALGEALRLAPDPDSALAGGVLVDTMGRLWVEHTRLLAPELERWTPVRAAAMALALCERRVTAQVAPLVQRAMDAPQELPFWRSLSPCLLTAGQSEAALPVTRAWTEAAPGSGEAWLTLAAVHRELRQVDAAGQALDRAQELLGPRREVVALRVSLWLLTPGQEERALKELAPLLERSPTDPSLWRLQAQLARSAGRRGELRAALDQVVTLDPSDEAARLERSQIDVGLGLLSRARAGLEPCAATSVTCALALAELLLQSGDAAAARELLRPWMEAAGPRSAALEERWALLTSEPGSDTTAQSP